MLYVKGILYDAKMEVVKKDLAQQLHNGHETPMLEHQNLQITLCAYDIHVY